MRVGDSILFEAKLFEIPNYNNSSIRQQVIVIFAINTDYGLGASRAYCHVPSIGIGIVSVA